MVKNERIDKLSSDEHVETGRVAGVVGFPVDDQIKRRRRRDGDAVQHERGAAAVCQAPGLEHGVAQVERPADTVPASVMQVIDPAQHVDIAGDRTGPAENALAVGAWMRGHVALLEHETGARAGEGEACVGNGDPSTRQVVTPAGGWLAIAYPGLERRKERVVGRGIHPRFVLHERPGRTGRRRFGHEVHVPGQVPRQGRISPTVQGYEGRQKRSRQQDF